MNIRAVILAGLVSLPLVAGAALATETGTCPLRVPEGTAA
jgi:hypothetical protein